MQSRVMICCGFVAMSDPFHIQVVMWPIGNIKILIIAPVKNAAANKAWDECHYILIKMQTLIFKSVAATMWLYVE